MILSGFQSIQKIYADFWKYYKKTFDWRHQKYFWPVYIYWLILVSYLYVSLWVLMSNLEPSDATTQLFAVHSIYYTRPLWVSLSFLKLLIVLFVLYYLIVKRYEIAIQYGVYFIGVLLLTPLFWNFAYFSIGLITNSIMCPDTGAQASFCSDG